MVPPKNKAFRQAEGFHRVEKPFSARWQTVKKVPEAEQLAPVGVQRYGRARVATEVKILAKQESFQLKSQENFLTFQIIQAAERPKNIY